MIKTEFKVGGDIYSRGDIVCSYKAGDRVAILSEIDQYTVNILVMEGEANSMIMPVEKSLLKEVDQDEELDY